MTIATIPQRKGVMHALQLLQWAFTYCPGALALAAILWKWPVFHSHVKLVQELSRARKENADSSAALELTLRVNEALRGSLNEVRDEMRDLRADIAESQRRLTIAIRWIVDAESARLAGRPPNAVPNDLRDIIFEGLQDLPQAPAPTEWR